MDKEFMLEAERIFTTYSCISAATTPTGVDYLNDSKHITVTVGAGRFVCSKLSDLKDLEAFCKLKETA